MRLHVECSSCGGTGVYAGSAEQNGVAVVCSTCKGTGGVDKEFVLFASRQRREGVKTVALRNHGVVLAPGLDQGEISYEAFLAGEMPTDDAGINERLTGKTEAAE